MSFTRFIWDFLLSLLLLTGLLLMGSEGPLFPYLNAVGVILMFICVLIINTVEEKQ